MKWKSIDEYLPMKSGNYFIRLVNSRYRCVAYYSLKENKWLFSPSMEEKTSITNNAEWLDESSKTDILSKVFPYWLLFVVIVCFGTFMYYITHKERPKYQKGQYFDLRGGSTVIEVNERERVVWFMTSDSTYFFEGFDKLGIK